jgi:hypothetical protein
MRFGLQQLFGFLTIVSLFSFLFVFQNEERIIWTKQPLDYLPPAVPDYFKQKPGGSIVVVQKWLPTLRYKDGTELYLENHRRGWESCRYCFFERKGQDYLDLVVAESEFDLKQDWQIEHCRRARADGWIACKTQIDWLREAYSDEKLRRKIGFNSRWLAVPPFIIFCLFFWWTKKQWGHTALIVRKLWTNKRDRKSL